MSQFAYISVGIDHILSSVIHSKIIEGDHWRLVFPILNRTGPAGT